MEETSHSSSPCAINHRRCLPWGIGLHHPLGAKHLEHTDGHFGSVDLFYLILLYFSLSDLSLLSLTLFSFDNRHFGNGDLSCFILFSFILFHLIFFTLYSCDNRLLDCTVIYLFSFFLISPFTFHLGFVHPLQDVALHQCLLPVAFLFQMVPSFLVMLSCHLLLGRPLDLFPLLGCHSVQRLVHLLSFIFATCPAHLRFCFNVCWGFMGVFLFVCLFVCFVVVVVVLFCFVLFLFFSY